MWAEIFVQINYLTTLLGLFLLFDSKFLSCTGKRFVEKYRKKQEFTIYLQNSLNSFCHLPIKVQHILICFLTFVTLQQMRNLLEKWRKEVRSLKEFILRKENSWNWCIFRRKLMFNISDQLQFNNIIAGQKILWSCPFLFLLIYLLSENRWH